MHSEHRFRRAAIAVLVTAAIVGPAVVTPVGASTFARADARPGALTEYAVGRREVVFVDKSRRTDKNGTYAGASDRTLPVLIMYPATGAPGDQSKPSTPSAKPARRAGPFPLIVFSHGFTASGPAYGEVLLRRIAAHGYVVAAPTFPLSNRNAPGGPKLVDYVNQPADVSFVIDKMLTMNRHDGPLHGLMDRKEIGAMGHSLGAITTLGVTYNSANADPRIKAAVPLSGLQLTFPGGTWTWPRVPLLLVHGDKDGTVPYAGSTKSYSKAKAPKFLLTLLGAPHTPFGAPYLDQIVRTIDNFLDRYLRHDKHALTRLERTGTVAGVSTLESDPG
jgi:dienelactone hydrolase